MSGLEKVHLDSIYAPPLPVFGWVTALWAVWMCPSEMIAGWLWASSGLLSNDQHWGGTGLTWSSSLAAVASSIAGPAVDTWHGFALLHVSPLQTALSMHHGTLVRSLGTPHLNLARLQCTLFSDSL